MEFNMQHQIFMHEALKEAKKGFKEGGIPIGSVLVHNNKIIGRGHNQRIQKNSATLHAEISALENAGRLSSKIYKQSTIYTTLSPCFMCSGAILLYNIPTVVVGENKNFVGAESLLKSHNIELIILNDYNCVQIMENFILDKPKLWNEDIGL